VSDVQDVTYDKEARAFYIKLSSEKVYSTVTCNQCMVNLDWAKDGSLIGVELLLPTKESTA
jgi:uncharacterized protein YuzE